MIVAYPFSEVDQELALKNARWMNELGGCKGHEVLMAYDKRCLSGTVDATRIELSKAFDQVHILCFNAPINGWPEGANYFFRTIAAWMQDKPWKFYFWLEPDAIPLAPGWLDKLEAEYRRAGRPFMGDRVQVEQIPLHMSGVGIYPNPLHQFSGEAYRAFDVAFDMAGKDQVVVQAHFTKLIEHAWKHPKFTSIDELRSQIRPEAILFHSSKDGSLIDLLRSKKGKETKASITEKRPKEPEEPGSPSPLRAAPGSVEEQRTPTRHDPVPPTTDIFIRTYEGDYAWLEWCLKGIDKFCTGFRQVIIVSPQYAPVWMLDRCKVPGLIPVGWKVMNDECEDGYLAQQATKLYADVILDYQPDFILHVDSDVIFTRQVTPGDFLSEGKVIWPHTPYSDIQTPWQPITEKFFGGKPVSQEFMRRFPLMVPRWLYPRVREYCYRNHGMTITDYIRAQPKRALSEFNVLGAYAFEFHHEKFVWIDTSHPFLGDLPEPFARQFYSWGGITPEVEKELKEIFGSVVSPPIAGDAGTAVVEGSRSLPLGVRELPDGLWVIEGDTHVSKWIEQEKRLDHDQNTLPDILPLIKEGDTVIDAGAFVGDHTIAYLRKVGPGGTVHAFEPNPLAMKCLNHNLAPFHDHDSMGRLFPHQVALGNEVTGNLPLSGNNHNIAGAYVGTHMPVAAIDMKRLDDFNLNPDFIKWDIEGCEVKALIGAQETIKRCHPRMVIEVNQEALDRQGNTVGELLALLESHGYQWKIMQENCGEFDPLYDIICSKESPEAPIRGKGEGASRCANPPPPVTSLFDAVAFLKDLAAQNTRERWRVMIALGVAGLTPKWKPKKKKKSHDQMAVPPPAEKESSSAVELLRPQRPLKPRQRSTKKLVPGQETP